MLLVVGQHLPVSGSDFWLMCFLHQTKRFADQIHVISKVTDPVVRNLGQFSEQNRLVADITYQLAKSQHGVGRELPGADECGYIFARVGDNAFGLTYLSSVEAA